MWLVCCQAVAVPANTLWREKGDRQDEESDQTKYVSLY